MPRSRFRAAGTVRRRPGRARSRSCVAIVIVVAGGLLTPAVVAALEVFPATVKLGGPRTRMGLVVTTSTPHHLSRDVTHAATYSSADPTIAAVESAVIRPTSNGCTTITVRVGEAESRVPVEVVGFGDKENSVSFRYETLAVLTRQGCNSGACHGSPSGKGGFRLSLRGFNPALDEVTLTREVFGRRTNPFSPEASLLLLKPTLSVAHGGGRRLAPAGSEYGVLRDWIAEGCRSGPPTAGLERFELYPARRMLPLQTSGQQLLALAHMADGTVKDVTELCAFTSTHPGVATVDGSGCVTPQKKGETAILARYLTFAARSHLAFVRKVRLMDKITAEKNIVDRSVGGKLAAFDVEASPLCTDSEFIRRVSLDVLGKLPTREEVEQFSADAHPAKRARLIDEYLARPGYAAFWAMRWSDVLRVSNARLTPAGAEVFHDWLVDALRDDMPYDEFVRQLLTATGSTLKNPPASYFRAAATSEDCAESTAQLFLGTRIQCAKCHNHPYEDWSQKAYYGLTAFFARIKRTSSEVPGEMIIEVVSEGEVKQPGAVQATSPTPPSGDVIDIPETMDRREALVDWLINPANEDFPRVAANRIWGALMGRGIVDPPDDFRLSNPPSIPELLDALAEEFVASGYSQKHIVRIILSSRTWQASSRVNSLNEDTTRLFSHFPARLLEAEQLFDAVCDVTGVPPEPGQVSGKRAVQLTSPDLNNDFLEIFGQPRRDTTCECERGSDPNLPRALLMANGSFVREKILHPQGRLAKVLESGEGISDREIITDLYYRAFSRPATGAEVAIALDHIASVADRRQGLEDIFWAVLNSREFLFQH